MKKQASSIAITYLGLFLALVAPSIIVLIVGPYLFESLLVQTAEIIVGMLFMWLLAMSLIVITRHGENSTLSSLGLVWPARVMILQAIGIGILLMLAVPVLSILSSALFFEEMSSLETVTQLPWWLILCGVITAGITEEILFRGYALERLDKLTENKLFSSVVALIFFVLVHIGGWNMAHVVGVVIPLGIVLILLYWWKRNAVMLMIIHVIVNLPMVFMAL